MIEFKPEVRIKSFTDALSWALWVLHEIDTDPSINFKPDVLTVTSINDGTHIEGSRHYSNEALDLRSKNFKDDPSKERFRVTYENRLNNHPKDPNKFSVQIHYPGTERQHFHIQPKKGEKFVGWN